MCCCPKCNNIVLKGDEVDKPGTQSVCCEECNVWWRWECAEITSEEQVEGAFVSPSCLSDMASVCLEDNELSDEDF